MLKVGAEIVSMSAISMIGEDENLNDGNRILYMSATINLTENKFDTNATVLDTNLYDQHYDEAEKDYEEFRKMVTEERRRLSAK